MEVIEEKTEDKIFDLELNHLTESELGPHTESETTPIEIESEIKPAPEIKPEKIVDSKMNSVEEPKKDITDLGDIFEFDFSKSGIRSIKEIKKEKYNSKAKLDPKTRHIKNKYFKVYEEYVTHSKTEKQLADKYKVSPSHISRMIKWVTLEIGDTDPDAQLRVTIDRLLVRQQEMNNVYKTATTIEDKTKIWKALLQVDRLLAQLKSLLNTALIDMSDKRQQVVVQMNEKFQRRIGSSGGDEKQLNEKEMKQIEATNVDQQTETMNVEHRIGVEE